MSAAVAQSLNERPHCSQRRRKERPAALLILRQHCSTPCQPERFIINKLHNHKHPHTSTTQQHISVYANHVSTLVTQLRGLGGVGTKKQDTH